MSTPPLKREKAVLVRDLGELRIGRDLAPLSPGPGPRFRLAGGAVRRLDAHLAEVARRRVSFPDGTTLLNAKADLSVVVAATGNSVIVETDRSWHLPIDAADSASFLPSGRLLVTAPVLHLQVLAGRSLTTNAEHRLLVIDPDRREVREQQLADVIGVGVTAMPHPSDGSILLEAGAGQDGSSIFVARETVDGDLTVEALFENEVSGGFDPRGEHLLLTPHPDFDDRARVVRWPDLEEIAVLQGGDGPLAGHHLEFYGCFLSAERVLLLALETGPLICSGTLEPLFCLDLDGREREIEAVTGLGRDLVATEGWSDGATRTAIWRVPGRRPRASK